MESSDTVNITQTPRTPRPALSLLAVIGLTVVLGIVLSSLLVYMETATRLRDEHTNEVRTEMQRLARLCALALREPLWNYAVEEANSLIEAAMIDPDVLSISVLEANRNPFAARARVDTNTTADEFITMTQAIVRQDAVLGELTIRISTAGYHTKLATITERYARSCILISLGALFFILAVMHWRLVRPMQRLVEASRQLVHGRLESPITAIRQDEIGSLAQSMEETRIALHKLFGEIEQRNAELKDANEHLEQRVAERTQSLTEALTTLSRAQVEMIQIEKLASLGRVVAGVAHELNTPLGNALTVATTLVDVQDGIRKEDATGKLRHSTLLNALERTQTGFDILIRNLDRAASIVQNFKQVAVDQANDQRRTFDAAHVVQEVLTLLSPGLRKANCTVDVHTVEGLSCDSFPGPFGQVLSNLVMNAVVHGLEDLPGGVVTIRLDRTDANHVRLTVHDNGHGMSEDVRKKIFDPFFTTKMGRGGTGLGMNIVQGIVVRILGGHITIDSAPGKGCTVSVVFPTCAPHMHD